MPAGIEAHDTMFSVRQMPWHGLGTVLEDYPGSVEEALLASGLGWQVRQGQVLVARPMTEQPTKGIYVPELECYVEPQNGWKANRREDTGEVLGIVSADYKIVQNEDAFRWLDALLGGELKWETAGSLANGKRVWVLATPGELVEIGGDESALYIYAANSHDGSMAVTAAATQVRIVCANTFGAALRRSEGCPRTYKFRHTGDLDKKMDEARRVMEIALNWDKAFTALGDELARRPMSERQLGNIVKKITGERNPELGDRAKENRQDIREIILNTYRGDGPEGDTRGNAPGTAWSAYNAIAEYADWGRRVTKKTDQMARSFEDQKMKDRALELVRESVGV